MIVPTNRTGIERARTLSELLDSKFEGPLGIRFGLDALLGLLPIFGDFATTVLSFYIILEAALAGCPLPVLIRMVINVLVENVVDFIPIIGNVFDFAWKSNRKNMVLWEAYQLQPHKIHRNSIGVIILLCVFLILSLGLSIYGGYWILTNLYQYFSAR